MKNVTASITVKKLNDFVNRFGAPGKLISDRGTSFTSDVFSQFCKNHGISHVLNSPRHPQANGLVERLNETILPSLQSSLIDVEGKYWDRNLSKLERHLNSSISKTTGKSPFEMMYGYVPRFGDNLMRSLTIDGEVYTPPNEVRELATERIDRANMKAKER